MASALAMMLGGAITNAFAFSGSNYLFSHMGSNVNEEKIRHDKAMEKLETAQVEYSKERIKRLDFLNEQEKKEHHGAQEFENVDQAMKQYYYATNKEKENRSENRSENPMGRSLRSEPVLGDFYTPSEDQKNREITFVVIGMALTGFVAWKLRTK